MLKKTLLLSLLVALIATSAFGLEVDLSEDKNTLTLVDRIRAYQALAYGKYGGMQ